MADPAFNPDQYLSEKASTGASSDFDPDAYLAQKSGAAQPESALKRYVRAGLETLPAAGMIAGGLLGTPADVVSGPGGTVLGAGLGTAGGEALKNAGLTLLGEGPKTMTDVATAPVKGFVEGAAGEGAGQVLNKGLELAAATKYGQAAISGLGKFGSKVGEAFTGVPQKEIETYAKNPTAVTALADSSDHDTQEMADQVRQKINGVIQTHKQALNDQISLALQNAPKDKNIDITPVVEKLEAFKGSLNPSLHKEDIADVQNLIDRIKGTSDLKKNAVTAYDAPNEKLAIDTGSQSQPRTELMTQPPNAPFPAKAGPDGWNANSVPVVKPQTAPSVPDWNAEDSVIELPVQGKPAYFANAQTLHQVNKFLQDKASSAYGSSPVGFQIGTTAAQAAKSAAAAGREILEPIAPPIAQANAGLSRLHDIEDVMNKNMLAEGKTASPLLAAGSGGNPANAKVLRQLGQETGQNVEGEVQNLAAARTFGNPKFTPTDVTGKAAARMMLASAIGGTAGYLDDGMDGAAIGATGGALLTSPAALKLAIDAGRGMGGFARAIPSSAVSPLFRPSINIPKGSTPQTPAAPQPAAPDMKLTPVPAKGQDKWAKDGLQNLLNHVSASGKSGLQLSPEQLKDPAIKDLLIKASDLKPGSKAMQNLMDQVKAKIAGNSEGED